MPPEGMPRPAKPGEANELSPSVKHLADEIGLKMKRPEAAEYAKEKGKFEEFHLAVFRAYWEDARNIGLLPVLTEIAGNCGLDGVELERVLKEGRYAAAIETQNREARELGVTGIPAYLVGNYFIEGAQPYSVFQKAVRLLQGGGPDRA
jgi:predicted DsbA family dithiol-disulfide isomerase